ncbi:hypothetical protein [Halorussus marinus]|uniref:hypothetical protein n=1 Tax=Halorussus marinus TaxID=2505976 RepID=UPI001092215F|nr:hypothetical protein [Halorussus marinus]
MTNDDDHDDDATRATFIKTIAANTDRDEAALRTFDTDVLRDMALIVADMTGASPVSGDVNTLAANAVAGHDIPGPGFGTPHAKASRDAVKELDRDDDSGGMPAGTARERGATNVDGPGALSANADASGSDAAINGTMEQYSENLSANADDGDGDEPEGPDRLNVNGRMVRRGRPAYESERKRLKRRGKWPPGDDDDEGDRR